MKVLDHIPPYDTHKIGVVYVGQGQVHTNFLCLKTARHHVSTLIDLAWVVPSHMHTHTHTHTSLTDTGDRDPGKHIWLIALP